MVKRILTRSILLVAGIIGLFTVAFTTSNPISATAVNTPTSNPDGSGGNLVQTATYQGVITRKINNQIYIDANNSTREFTLPNQVAIRRNGAASKIEDLQIGDQVTVTVSAVGQEVLIVDAVDNSLINALRTLAVVIPLLLVLLIVVYLVIRNSQRGYVKTTTSSLKP